MPPSPSSIKAIAPPAMIQIHYAPPVTKLIIPARFVKEIWFQAASNADVPALYLIIKIAPIAWRPAQMEPMPSIPPVPPEPVNLVGSIAPVVTIRRVVIDALVAIG